MKLIAASGLAFSSDDQSWIQAKVQTLLTKEIGVYQSSQD